MNEEKFHFDTAAILHDGNQCQRHQNDRRYLSKREHLTKKVPRRYGALDQLRKSLRLDDALNRADCDTTRPALDTLALITFISVDDVDISFGDCLIGAFRQTESAGSTFVSDLHSHK